MDKQTSMSIDWHTARSRKDLITDPWSHTDESETARHFGDEDRRLSLWNEGLWNWQPGSSYSGVLYTHGLVNSAHSTHSNPEAVLEGYLLRMLQTPQMVNSPRRTIRSLSKLRFCDLALLLSFIWMLPPQLCCTSSLGPVTWVYTGDQAQCYHVTYKQITFCHVTGPVWSTLRVLAHFFIKVPWGR